MQLLSPTATTYSELQNAYEHFNKVLFDNALPACLITLQREKRTCGYFSAQRWANVEGQFTDEIALNPAYFAVTPIVETMQTLVHEMVHLWQHHFGKPGRGRYHNDEWANKMESIGLMPSSTGQPGGKRTGDHMGDYAVEGGRFLMACQALLTAQFKLSWYDRFPAEEHVAHGQASYASQLSDPAAAISPAQANQALANVVKPTVKAARQSEDGTSLQAPNRSNRIKYTCPSCAQQVWGKPGLRLLCGGENCDSIPFV
ncbi:SprT family zinc-dependent metalloprotease [Lampropedia puyangensis]|uniref:SprT family zinc-dependent metalloprotease n=1 Tax=Lampropedia puyangensis TaxID=1330072 RepID=A0A4S8EXQ6_9BURK|nr:SprT-like domain-containing protein [Lampropedia puyangensis]THT98423.1 SprT family zinc-dependent metalloprotease [Lampropedia puyangensis]